MFAGMSLLTSPTLWGGIASAVGSLVGGSSANAKNKALMEAQNQFTKDEAGRARTWQEKMSNTAYQRAVDDLKKAGLNPMLAYSQGPASTPGGASGSASSTPEMEDLVTPAISSAARVAETYHTIENMKQNNKNLQAQETLIQKQANEADSRTDLNSANAEAIRGYKAGQAIATTDQQTASAANLRQQTETLKAQMPNIRQSLEKLKHETNNEAMKTTIMEIERELVDANERLARGQLTLQAYQTKIATATSKLLSNQLPKSENEAEAQKSWYMRNIAPYLPDFLKGTGTAADVLRSVK